MNKQNLLPSKFLVKYSLRQLMIVALRCLVPIVLMGLIMTGMGVYLDHEISEGYTELQKVADNKQKYENTKAMISQMEDTIRSNDEKLKYVQSLQGDFSKFDILITYLIDMKPYNLAFISIEDFDVVPPPDQTSDIVQKPSVSDVLTGEVNETQIVSTTKPNGENTSGADTSGEVGVGQDSIISDTPNSNDSKYDSSLTYSRDISLSNILIRGYCTDVHAVSDYVTSVASAPEIEGYTLEGVEDKVTSIKGTNIILFEIKLKMRGVVE